MKTSLILLLAGLALPLLEPTCQAESPAEREMAQLKEQRDKAIADSTKSLNERYKSAVEQLYHKAVSNKDAGAEKIKAELDTFGPQPQNAPASGTASAKPSGAVLPQNIIGSWTVGNSAGWKAIYEFKADGTCAITPGAAKLPTKICTWSKVENRIEVVAPDGNLEAFNLPVRAGKLSGANSTGTGLTAVKNH